jgi:hypothetical protein
MVPGVAVTMPDDSIAVVVTPDGPTLQLLHQMVPSASVVMPDGSIVSLQLPCKLVPSAAMSSQMVLLLQLSH